jgi:hypothetical protein
MVQKDDILQTIASSQLVFHEYVMPVRTVHSDLQPRKPNQPRCGAVLEMDKQTAYLFLTRSCNIKSTLKHSSN